MTSPVAVNVHVIELFEPSPNAMPIIDPVLKQYGRLWIPLAQMEPTKALRRWLNGGKHQPSLCILHQDDQCHGSHKCNQAHVKVEFMDAVRQTLQNRPFNNCCRGHGDLASKRVAFQEKFKTRRAELHTEAGVLPILPDWLAVTSFFDAETEPVIKIVPAKVCQLHQRQECKYGADCRNVHLCRQFWACLPEDYRKVPEVAASEVSTDTSSDSGSDRRSCSSGSGDEIPWLERHPASMTGTLLETLHPTAVNSPSNIPMPPPSTKWTGTGHQLSAAPYLAPTLTSTVMGKAQPYVTVGEMKHCTVACPQTLGSSTAAGQPSDPAAQQCGSAPAGTLGRCLASAFPSQPAPTPMPVRTPAQPLPIWTTSTGTPTPIVVVRPANSQAMPLPPRNSPPTTPLPQDGNKVPTPGPLGQLLADVTRKLPPTPKVTPKWLQQQGRLSGSMQRPSVAQTQPPRGRPSAPLAQVPQMNPQFPQAQQPGTTVPVHQYGSTMPTPSSSAATPNWSVRPAPIEVPQSDFSFFQRFAGRQENFVSSPPSVSSLEDVLGYKADFSEDDSIGNDIDTESLDSSEEMASPFSKANPFPNYASVLEEQTIFQTLNFDLSALAVDIELPWAVE